MELPPVTGAMLRSLEQSALDTLGTPFAMLRVDARELLAILQHIRALDNESEEAMQR